MYLLPPDTLLTPSALFFRPALLCVLLLGLVAVPAQAVQVVLTAAQDSTLYQDAEGDIGNGSGQYLFMGKTGPAGGNELRRSLVRFDLSAIPADALVMSVTVQFEINQLPSSTPNGGTAALHRVNASWSEGSSDPSGNEGTGTVAVAGDSTWLHRTYSGTTWTAAGGDFAASPSGTRNYGASLGELTFASSAGLVADVQSWIATPANNFGWMLRGEETLTFTARRLYSDEDPGATGPRLTVEYVRLSLVASGLDRPVAIANAGDGSGRVFIVERDGVIRIFDTLTQALLPTPYLDITGLVDSTASEQGLLGLAFHPDFPNNRKFYVYYIRDPGAAADRSVVALFTQSAGNANVADATPTTLMEFAQPADNHNGGDLHFGTDGYLYIASGDGGGSNDVHNNAQNVNTLMGKILRIDVDAAPGGAELCGLVAQYAIPPGNAFPGSGNGCDEILHMGLRNPWRFSFDAQTGDMYIGDVGQGSWEEIDFAPAGSPSLNFGWPCREGLHAGSNPNNSTCPSPVNPIIEYASTGECAVTGGYLYRGLAPSLHGYYIYGDYCTQRIWRARNQGSGWVSQELSGARAIMSPTSSFGLSAFGQDERCELYVADVDAGKVYRFTDAAQIHRSGFEDLQCR